MLTKMPKSLEPENVIDPFAEISDYMQHSDPPTFMSKPHFSKPIILQGNPDFEDYKEDFLRAVNKYRILSIDTEWCLSPPGTKQSSQPAITIFGTLQNQIYLIDYRDSIQEGIWLPDALREVLENDTIVKIGSNIDLDITNKDWPKISNFIDTQDLAKDFLSDTPFGQEIYNFKEKRDLGAIAYALFRFDYKPLKQEKYEKNYPQVFIQDIFENNRWPAWRSLAYYNKKSLYHWNLPYNSATINYLNLDIRIPITFFLYCASKLQGNCAPENHSIAMYYNCVNKLHSYYSYNTSENTFKDLCSYLQIKNSKFCWTFQYLNSLKSKAQYRLNKDQKLYKRESEIIKKREFASLSRRAQYKRIRNRKRNLRRRENSYAYAKLYDHSYVHNALVNIPNVENEYDELYKM